MTEITEYIIIEEIDKRNRSLTLLHRFEKSI